MSRNLRNLQHVQYSNDVARLRLGPIFPALSYQAAMCCSGQSRKNRKCQALRCEHAPNLSFRSLLGWDSLHHVGVGFHAGENHETGRKRKFVRSLRSSQKLCTWVGPAASLKKRLGWLAATDHLLITHVEYHFSRTEEEREQWPWRRWLVCQFAWLTRSVELDDGRPISPLAVTKIPSTGRCARLLVWPRSSMRSSKRKVEQQPAGRFGFSLLNR